MTRRDATETGAQQGLPPETLYLPFEAGPHRMLMGLVARHPDELIEIDETYPAEMVERHALLDGRRDEVFAALAVSEQARRETLDRIAAVLPARYPAWFARHGDRLCNRLTGEEWDVSHPPCNPLELAGRLVQEDLCLIQPTDAGPVLQAAVLCAPSRWRLLRRWAARLRSFTSPYRFTPTNCLRRWTASCASSSPASSPSG